MACESWGRGRLLWDDGEHSDHPKVRGMFKVFRSAPARHRAPAHRRKPASGGSAGADEQEHLQHGAAAFAGHLADGDAEGGAGILQEAIRRL